MRAKGFFMALLAALIMAFSGCATTLSQSETESLAGWVGIVDIWGGHDRTIGERPVLGLSDVTPLRGVTVVVANPTKADSTVTISCKFKSDGVVFGSASKVVKAGHKSRILVRGFARIMDNVVTCEASSK